MSGWRPGDRRADTESMLRVDQAGEYGATRIYAGQLAVLRSTSPASKLVARMAGQEKRHLERFDAMMTERRVLCLKAAFRLEWRGEQGQAEAKESDNRRGG